MNSSLLFKPAMSRKRPAETVLDLLGTERAKRRYVSEYLSSELTALSIRKEPDKQDTAEESNDAMDVDDGTLASCPPSRRKHVVLVTDLEDTSESEESEQERENGGIELIEEVRKCLSRVPKDVLKTRKAEQPSMALVKYQRPSWWPPEPPNQISVRDASTTSSTRLCTAGDTIQITDKRLQTSESTDEGETEGNGVTNGVNGGYLGDDDDDLEEMDL